MFLMKFLSNLSTLGDKADFDKHQTQTLEILIKVDFYAFFSYQVFRDF